MYFGLAQSCNNGRGINTIMPQEIEMNKELPGRDELACMAGGKAADSVHDCSRTSAAFRSRRREGSEQRLQRRRTELLSGDEIKRESGGGARAKLARAQQRATWISISS
jgi:hypothetical protein